MLLANDGRAHFSRVDAGLVFQTGYLGRCVASGDFDGAVDIAFVSLGEAPVLLRNEAAHRNRWLGVRLRGTVSNRDAIGAKLSLHVGDRILTRWIAGGGSFLGSHDRRVVFGLGREGAAGDLEIRWPNGRLQRVQALAPYRYHDITEASDVE